MGHKKRRVAPGTWVERSLFESKAFLALKGVAPQILIIFLGKRQFETHGRKGKERRVCINCDSINFTYIEAEKKYNISKSRFSRAIGDLLAKGFIKIRHHGGGYQKDKTIYELTNNWLIWSEGIVFEEREKQRIQRGFCKPKSKLACEDAPIHNPINDT